MVGTEDGRELLHRMGIKDPNAVFQEAAAEEAKAELSQERQTKARSGRGAKRRRATSAPPGARPAKRAAVAPAAAADGAATKRPAAILLWERAPDDAVDGGRWPPGWTKARYRRGDGSSCDNYWTSPGGRRFRSMTEVRRFLRALGESGGDEGAAFRACKAPNGQKARRSPAGTAGSDEKGARKEGRAPPAGTRGRETTATAREEGAGGTPWRRVAATAPPGKLGLLLANLPGKGRGTRVSGVRPGSVMEGRVPLEARLLAIDGEDVRRANVQEITTIMAGKSERERALVLLVPPEQETPEMTTTASKRGGTKAPENKDVASPASPTQGNPPAELPAKSTGTVDTSTTTSKFTTAVVPGNEDAAPTACPPSQGDKPPPNEPPALKSNGISTPELAELSVPMTTATTVAATAILGTEVMASNASPPSQENPSPSKVSQTQAPNNTSEPERAETPDPTTTAVKVVPV